MSLRMDKRIERNTRSVLALRDYLRKIIQNPASFTDKPNLVEALISQGALSKFSDESLGICGSSLNTTKRVADNTLEGGFDALNRLRIGAQEAIAGEKAKGKPSNKVNKIGLSKRIKEQEIEIKRLQQDLLITTLALNKSLAQSRYFAAKADDPSVLALCKKEQRVLQDTLSLRKYPIPGDMKSVKIN